MVFTTQQSPFTNTISPPVSFLYYPDSLNSSNVLRAIPTELNREEWILVLPRALVAGFVKTDMDFQEKVQSSGTTVTFVIVEGSVITVASVGDSWCILESVDGGLYYLSADHRLECSEEERDRVIASGGEVGRLNAGGGVQAPINPRLDKLILGARQPPDYRLAFFATLLPIH
ncbi:hypothetical protein LXL04_004530 [Taraxacum kok-saghyz]